MRGLTAAVAGASRSEAFLSGYSVRLVNGRALSHTRGCKKLGSASPNDIQPEPATATGRGSVAEERHRQIWDGLSHSDVFGALADDDLDRLIGQGRVTTYSRRSVVLRKGDPADDLMIVLCGRIRLSSASRHGKEVLFDFIGSGRCLGREPCSAEDRHAGGHCDQTQRSFCAAQPRCACLRRTASGGSLCG